MIKLGMKYRDLLTGYEGIATGFAHYITGCGQALIQSRCWEGNKKPEPHWIDEQRLEQVGDEVVELPEIDEGRLVPDAAPGAELPASAQTRGAVRAVTGADIEAPKR